MNRSGIRGFTLIELLVVILVIAVMVALLLPAFYSTTQIAAATRCKTNLNRIYQASMNWRLDNGGILLSGEGWMGKLFPYVEKKDVIFRCAGRNPDALYNENTVTGHSGSDLSGEWKDLPSPSPTSPSESQTSPPETWDSSFQFNIYWRQGSSAHVLTGSPIRGALAWSIPIENHPWVRRTVYTDHVYYQVDDEGYDGNRGTMTCDDIWFNVYYEDGKPTKIAILQQPGTGPGASPIGKYQYDFLCNGSILVSNWINHIGEVVDLKKPNGPVGQDGGSPDNPDPPEVLSETGLPNSSSETGLSGTYQVIGDYGLSRGTYTVGTAINKVDPKLFFILDYGKSLADYNGYGGNDDNWYKYFIEKPDEWLENFGSTLGTDWKLYQSLRHFGEANVLFCDGHIESLDANALNELSPLWKYTGR